MSKLAVLGTLVALAAFAMADTALAQEDGDATDNETATATGTDTPAVDTSSAPDNTADDGGTPVAAACPPGLTTTKTGAPCTATPLPDAAPVPSFATLGPLGGGVRNWVVAGADAR